MSLLEKFLEKLAEVKQVERVDEEISTELEIARYVLSSDKSKTLIFNRVLGHARFRVLCNLVSTMSKIRLALNVDKPTEVYSKLLSACNNPLKPRVVDSSDFMENTSDKLAGLPILKYFEKDGGRYITGGIIIARDPETGFQNASFHRLMVIDERHMVIRIVPRHLYKIFVKYSKNKRDTPIAIIIGTHPCVLLAAASSPRYGVDEICVANRLLNGEVNVVYLEDVGLCVPEASEIVIQGKIAHNKFVEEGPFVDITGTYDIIRQQPVVEVEKTYFRNNALYHAIVPASAEHRRLMGLYREALIWDYVNKVVPSVKDVYLTDGGCGWLHCVISIIKEKEGDAKNAILAAFAAHPSLKMVIIVDDDINIRKPQEVEWALATRYQPDEDTVIISGIRGSSLDPSSDQEKLITSKIGIDATRPLDKDYQLFKKWV